jgi:hypothetical protein
MYKRLAGALLVIGISVVLEGMTFAASWVESKNQGMIVRHPKGWKVDWVEQGVGVFHPQDPMIWSVVRSEQFQGSSRQVAEEVVKGAASQVGEVKPLIQKQVSQRPDLYGIKFSGQRKGIPFTALVLVATEDGRNFVIREYSAPTKVYDEMKLTLVPILCSFCGQGGGGAGGASESGGKSWKAIQSPRGIWRFTAPSDWKLARGAFEEEQSAAVIGPKQQLANVEFWSGSAEYTTLVRRNLAPSRQIPFLPAHELLQRIIIPGYQIDRGIPDLKIERMQPIDPSTVRYTLSYTAADGKPITVEGILKNSSIQNGQGGDFNVYTQYFVQAPKDVFPTVKDEAWQVVMSFESSPQWGSFLMQTIARMRSENLQAATNRVLQTMQNNKQIMAQHVAVAQQRPAAMAQQGQGWINAVTGQEAVRDPQTGQKWQVPVGGQFIYGSNAGEVIRADRPLRPQEMPDGFRQFEAVK